MPVKYGVMVTMKQTTLILVALIAGFVGGVLGTRISQAGWERRSQTLLRAQAFELVDETGNTISYWGIDKRNYAVLAFGSQRPVGSTGGRDYSRVDMTNPHNQRATIGVIDDSPFLDLRAADGELRARLNLSIYAKPLLSMWDETGKRLALGVEHSDAPSAADNDWALRFAPDRAGIGMLTREAGGAKYVQGFFYLNKEKVKYP
jgi:hypothetical protein